jgi:hypothetical protein
MALNQSALNELLDALRAGGDLDVVREALALVLQALIEAEAAQQIGAGRYERTETRTTHRNGTRTRLLSTKAGPPSTRAWPALGRSRPRTIRIEVDLPAPLGPRNPVTLPGWTTNERSSTARVGPYRLVSPCSSIMRVAPSMCVLGWIRLHGLGGS